jgi:hypothetical protein
MDIDTSTEAQSKDSNDENLRDENSHTDVKNHAPDDEEIRTESKFKAARNLYLSTNSPVAPNNLSNPDVGEVLFW